MTESCEFFKEVRCVKRKEGLSSLLYLLHHHPELGLPAENRFDPWQPLHVGEDFGWTDQNLARVEPVCLIEEQALKDNKDTSWVGVQKYVTPWGMIESVDSNVLFKLRENIYFFHHKIKR